MVVRNYEKEIPENFTRPVRVPSLFYLSLLLWKLKKKKLSFLFPHFQHFSYLFFLLFLRNNMLIFLLFPIPYCSLPFLQEDASQSCCFTWKLFCALLPHFNFCLRKPWWGTCDWKMWRQKEPSKCVERLGGAHFWLRSDHTLLKQHGCKIWMEWMHF